MQYFKPLNVEIGSQICYDPDEINSSSFTVRKNSFSIAKRCTRGYRKGRNCDRTYKTSSAALPRINSGVSFNNAVSFEPPSCWSAVEYERLSNFSSSLHDESVSNIDSINVSSETIYPIVHDHPKKVSRKHRDTVCLHEGKNNNYVGSHASGIDFPVDRTNLRPNSPVDSHHSPSEVSEFLPTPSLIKGFAVKNKPSSSSGLSSNETVLSNKLDSVGKIVDIHRSGHDDADSVGKSPAEGFADKPTETHSSLNQFSDVVLPKNLKNSSQSVAVSNVDPSVKEKFDKSYAESRKTEIPVAAPRKKPIAQSQDLKSRTAETCTTLDRCEGSKAIEDHDTKSPASSDFDSTNRKSFGLFRSPAAVKVSDTGCTSEKLPIPTDLESSSVLLADNSGVQNMTAETRDGNFGRYSEDRESVASSRSFSHTFTKCHIGEPHLPAAEVNFDARAPLQKRREALKHNSSNCIHDGGKEFADSNGNASDSSLELCVKKNSVTKNIKKRFPSKGECTKALSDSPLLSRTLKGVSPYFITKPEKTEVFINSPGKQGDLEDLEPFVITKTDKIEVLTDLSVKSPALLNTEPYFVGNPEKIKDSANTRTKLNALSSNVSQTDVVEKVFSQNDISFLTTVVDADDLNGSKYKKGIENAMERNFLLIKPRKSAPLLITDNGDITDNGGNTDNGVLPINDDSRYSVVEQKPPQKAPRKLVRTSANNAVSTTAFNTKRESNENFDHTEKEVTASDVRSSAAKNDRVDRCDDRRNETNSTGSVHRTYDGQNSLSYKTGKKIPTPENPSTESRKESDRPEPRVDAEKMPGDKTIRVSAKWVNRFLICGYFMLVYIFPSDLKDINTFLKKYHY